MNILELPDASLCVRLAATMGHFLWQGAAVYLLVIFAGLLLRRSSVGARYAVFTAALLVMAVCPSVTFVLLRSPEGPATTVGGQSLPYGAAAAALGAADRPSQLRLRILRLVSGSTGEQVRLLRPAVLGLCLFLMLAAVACVQLASRPTEDRPIEAVPPGMVGTWFFENPMGDDEQMAVFADGRIVVLYSNGHRGETRYTDGAIELAEYGNLKAKLILLPDGTLQTSTERSGIAKLWQRIDAVPKTELLRPLTEPPAEPPATQPVAEPAAKQPVPVGEVGGRSGDLPYGTGALSQPRPDDIADVSVQDLTGGGNDKMRYFLIGPREDERVSAACYKLLVVLPGGDGGADFNPFVCRIFKNALPAGYIVAQPVAFKWVLDQQIVWPTRIDRVMVQQFATEDFVEAVIKDVQSKHKVDDRCVFTLSWSSGGPAAYAISLAENSPVTGSFVAMSVFKPDRLPSLDRAQGHAYYIYHSPDDRVCSYRMAQQAENMLKEKAAAVTLKTYPGGHGWKGGDIFGVIRTGVDWLEKHAPDR